MGMRDKDCRRNLPSPRALASTFSPATSEGSTSGESIKSRENELEVDNANPVDNTAASCYSEGNKKHSLFTEDNGESEDIVDVDGGMCLI